MDNPIYSYQPIVERPPLRWPNNARVAFYIGLNVEHYEVDKPSTSIVPATAHLVPDPLNYGWRDYGVRVGIWRMIEALDRAGMRASVLLNSDVCRLYPQIVAAGRRRDWVWLAHGKNNSVLQPTMAEAEERQYLKEVVETIADATGKPVQGWMGPALSESFATSRLVRELGLTYLLDWCADDQPFPLEVEGMWSVPYAIELNDIPMFIQQGLNGEAFLQAVKDQFDRLYAEGERTGRVMALALHPFVIGQPFRMTYLEQALDYILGHDGVWATTSDEIAAFCRDQAGTDSGR